MLKRKRQPDFYGVKKRKYNTLQADGDEIKQTVDENTDVPKSKLPSDSEAALSLLLKDFPVEKFSSGLPPIAFVHQLYSIVKCKTTVDREIDELQACNKVRLFKLGAADSSLAVVFTADLKKVVATETQCSNVVKKFFDIVLNEIRDVSVEKNILRQRFHLSEHDVSELVNTGLLAVRSASSYWFSVPSVGQFIRTYLKGRKAVLGSVRKSKYSEILLSELEKRPFEKSLKLGIQYYIHDIVGAELVNCIETTSGIVLRFMKSSKKHMN